MNTTDINTILRGRCSAFLGTYPSNHLPEGDEGWAVINLDDCRSPGTHWVVVGIGKQCEYFDSFGVLPLSDSILKYLKNKCVKGWWYNDVSFQSPTSSMCGYYCIYFILMRCKGHSPCNIVKTLASIRNPDIYVHDFVAAL